VAKELSVDETIEQIVTRLQEKHPEYARADIEAAARSEYAELAARPVQDYMAILVERAAKKRLKKAQSPDA
jgi:hypothetical protein